MSRQEKKFKKRSWPRAPRGQGTGLGWTPAKRVGRGPWWAQEGLAASSVLPTTLGGSQVSPGSGSAPSLDAKGPEGGTHRDRPLPQQPQPLIPQDKNKLVDGPPGPWLQTAILLNLSPQTSLGPAT